jgi:hypothetical protein
MFVAAAAPVLSVHSPLVYASFIQCYSSQSRGSFDGLVCGKRWECFQLTRMPPPVRPPWKVAWTPSVGKITCGCPLDPLSDRSSLVICTLLEREVVNWGCRFPRKGLTSAVVPILLCINWKKKIVYHSPLVCLFHYQGGP